MRFRTLVASLTILFFGACGAPGVILFRTDDPSVNVSTPGDNSGWQYEGQWGAYLGTPIAPNYFITAHHIGGNVGDPFLFHGQTYTTTAVFEDPETDLQIWQVSETFPCYAPLYDQTNDEPGSELRVFGRGTQRGTPVSLDETLRGWNWGTSDSVERWGSNVVTTIADSGNGIWYFLQAAFDATGLPDEAHLSVGDSGGGVFLLEDGLWRLAGINYGVDDLRTTADASTGFVAAVFDERGFYAQDAAGDYVLVPEDGPVVPTSFYSTQISSRLDWIESVTGVAAGTLPTESFADWQAAYFTPDQIADATVSGPTADPDADGIVNLLEFAFNLDPTFAEPAVMIAGTGLRGLPLIQAEQISATDQRLTVEFVRRTASSGSGLTYTEQFASSLTGSAADWQDFEGQEMVTPINARWERVKIIDTISLGDANPTRFARVSVSQSPTASPAMAVNKH